MSVDYTKAICFGVIIPEDLANKIINKVSKKSEDEFELFMDAHCRQIDAWSGGDYFLGFIGYLGSDLVVPFKEIKYNTFHFDCLLDEYGISNMIRINFLPSSYIITFCH